MLLHFSTGSVEDHSREGGGKPFTGRDRVKTENWLLKGTRYNVFIFCQKMR